MSAQAFQLHPERRLFSNVLAVSRPDTTQQFVGKVFDKEHFVHLHNELAILLALRDCPVVVSMYGAIPYGQNTALIMERMDGDVLDLLEEPSYRPHHGLDIFIQTCKAIQSCHQRDVAHLDIKPENLLYSRSNQSPSGYSIKLTDFGSSAYKRPETRGFFGTLYYGAPECVAHWEKKNPHPYDTKKADLWSLGILLHVLLTNTWPYHQAEDGVVAEQILSHSLHLSSLLPPRLRRIVSALLRKDPDERASIEWVLAQLEEDEASPATSPRSPRVSPRRRPLRRLLNQISKCTQLSSA